MGFTAATPIQAAVIPTVLAGRNLFAGAKTGSGKTMAFLAPIVERLLNGEAKKALILGPTRELVLQMDEEAAKLLEGQTDVVSVPVYGGVPIDPQILAIRHHRPRIFIATPGRCLDLIQEEMLSLGDIEISVLDEADRMCDMGFAPQVTEILELLVNCKQTLLFSATLPKELSEMMNKFCPDPIRIQVDASDESSETIQHQAVFATRNNKLEKLIELIKPPEVTGLVFTRTRHGADALHRTLDRQARNIGILHAGFSMGDRERTIRAFREGEIRILIATDVVSRGIDIDRITHVIHFDLPDSLEDYIHRSGRSGRAGRKGNTIAFFEKDNRDHMEKLKELKKKVQFEFLESPASSSEERPAGNSRRPARADSRPPRNADRNNSRRPSPRHRGADIRNEPRAKAPVHTKTKDAKPRSDLISKTKKLIGKIFGR
ncbi:MAG: hypothetical protein JWQ35_1816 [Bacteriovoracaceae bacterium]|nr:hypothetical protein [Bacteriovoracaceae bacterium]